MARNSLTLQSAYMLLQVPRSASIEDIKQAYRKRAFALHPDLHPDNQNASDEFQRVNEAYVTIISYLDSQAKKKSVKAQFVNTQTRSHHSTKNPFQDEKRKTEDEKRRTEEKRAEERRRRQKECEERQERERKEMERRQAKERARREEERRRRIQEEIERQQEKLKAKQEEERLNLIKGLEEKAQEFKKLIIEQMEQARVERENKEKNRETVKANSRETQKETRFSANTYNASGSPVYNKYAGNYEQTVFNKGQDDKKGSADMFANFTTSENTSENTAYVHVETEKRENLAQQEKNQKEYFTGSEIFANKEKSISQVISKAGQDHLEGIKKGLSSWFKSQIDEELELFFPAAKLQPGVKMRLQFRIGLANELQTIELTLPKDFIPGKALRLKGLGKKIGKWQGDLYLKLQSK